jgi:hypothetical protein
VKTAVAASVALSIALVSQTATPVFTVDPQWPRALPNRWQVGPVSGIATDALDRIWIVQRIEAVRQAGGAPAPPVLVFDQQGVLTHSWGGPGSGYDWPEQVHGISVDPQDRVWISGNGERDSHILAFSQAGSFIRQIGRAGQKGGSNDTRNLGRATQMRFDSRAREVFVSDGEMNQNHRVIVFDSETGAYKRHWGAYGARPDDAAVEAKFNPAGPPPKQFGAAVHCLRIDRDGFVYVCDRSNNRFQVFRKDGTFVREVFVARETAGAGSVWDIEFSPTQEFLYVADGTNQKVWILKREDMQVVGSFGGPGQAPGSFATALHDITVDSRGNLYTGEAAAAGRVQRFLIK